jgi:hypothetical protein
LRWRLPRLAVAAVAWGLAAWVRPTRAVREQAALALAGSRPAPQRRAGAGHRRPAPLLQVRLDEKTSEIPVAQALLP